MKVLVTGGAGFIGSHVVDRLTAAGHDPVIFDVRPSPYHAGVETRLGDLLDAADVLRAAEGCDAIAHLAASADVGIVAKEPVEAEALNARGTINVLEAARAHGCRVLYASTIWAYSDVVADEVDEDTGIALPSHLYTATKVAGEMYCKSYGELFGVDWTILRFGIPYGPRARPAAVIPIFVRKALAGEPLTIAGDGAQTRRFVYVEDLAEGVVRALRPAAAKRVYNLVGEEDTSVRDIADAVRATVGDVEIVHTEGRNGDFAGAQVSGKRAASELGWTASTPFSEGLRRYVHWYERDQAKPAAVSAGARVRSGMGQLLVASGRTLVLAVLALVAYLYAVHAVSLSEGQMSTVALVCLLTIVTTFAGLRRAAMRQAWIVGSVAIGALFFHPVAHLLHIAALDVPLLLLGAAGAGLVLAILERGGEELFEPVESRA